MGLPAMAIVLLMALLQTGTAAAENRAFSKPRDANTEPSHAQYEYIVVGGGTAGCAIAATLSEHYKVLLLERGGTPYGNPSIERLEGWADLLRDDPTESSERSPIQAFRSADGVHNRRARVLGGGSAINAGFYSRASDAEVRAAGWKPKSVQEAYEWVEERIASPASLGPWQKALKNGLVQAGVTPDNGLTYEHIQGTKLGHSIFDAQGRRHTAADLLSSANGELLTVLTFASAQRIIFNVSDAQNKQPRATGVEYTDSRNATHFAHLQDGLQNEVILSAGALGSPQLLLLSGIGSCEHLAEFNITCHVDLSAVGAEMVDNPINAIVVVSPQPLEISLISVAGITHEGVIIEGASGGNWTWQWPGMGQLNIFPPLERSVETISLVQTNLQNLSSNTKEQIDQSGFILSKVYDPISSGTLRLKSRDVSQNPYVKFNYYTHPRDVETCIRGVKYLHKLLQTPAFEGFRYTTVTPIIALLYPELSSSEGERTDGAYIPDLQNRTETADWCRNTVTTIWHFHGGCVLGKVVDKRYRVFGVRSLRVVDGSTFTKSPGTNPQATVMMLGRYVGVRMLKDRKIAEETVNSRN
ncbi:hypothetical protein M758_4G208800 [Ceratodon purpureus]|nr:hypothetical protein M758_4G208800 [Ceratodon purpureus]KAG0620342.1 hypothetical protein M758_4G208800 [Ceratodon purpureus]KAG0620343.1 hypothetical protein M758_4G208800 [Ceratodon purpureus]KAG0620344.1 hypothetical protein M758_4G208800 [Ceratodon purpureus]